MATRLDEIIDTIESHWTQAEEESWTGRRWVRLLDLPMKYAKTPLPVRLTRNHIAKAVSNSHSECAYANACTAINGVIFAWVTKTTAYLFYEDKIVFYSLPSSVQKEVVVNDRNVIHVDPGDYHLAPVSPSMAARYREAERNMKRPKTRNKARTGTGHRADGVRGLVPRPVKGSATHETIPKARRAAPHVTAARVSHES